MVAHSACLSSHFLLLPWTSSSSDFFLKRRGRYASLSNARVTGLHGRAVALPSKLWPRTVEGRERLGSSLRVNASTTSVAGLNADLEARISLAVSTGRLDLSDCGLVEVPSRIFEITDLVDLSLAGNRITSLPEDIKNLRAVGFSRQIAAGTTRRNRQFTTARGALGSRKCSSFLATSDW